MSSTPGFSPLNRQQFGLTEHAVKHFHATVPAGTTTEQLEHPHFWSNVRQQMGVFARIEVTADDGSFVALLVVQGIDDFGVFVKQVYKIDLKEVAHVDQVAAQKRYVVQNKGQLKWCVVDTMEKINIKEGITRESDAVRELEEFIRAQAR